MITHQPRGDIPGTRAMSMPAGRLSVNARLDVSALFSVLSMEKGQRTGLAHHPRWKVKTPSGMLGAPRQAGPRFALGGPTGCSCTNSSAGDVRACIQTQCPGHLHPSLSRRNCIAGGRVATVITRRLLPADL